MKLNKEEILKQIDKCDEEIKAWEKINKHLWKKAYIKKRDLLIELDKAPLDKPVEVIKTQVVEKIVEKPVYHEKIVEVEKVKEIHVPIEKIVEVEKIK